jgi:hypothetical protein
VTTLDDVLLALLPVLPILAKPVLIQEDPVERFRRRIAMILPGIEGAVLDTNQPADEVVRSIVERQ